MHNYKLFEVWVIDEMERIDPRTLKSAEWTISTFSYGHLKNSGGINNGPAMPMQCSTI